MNRDAIAFALVVAGALCAECIPLASALIGAAWVVKKRSRPWCGQHQRRQIGATNIDPLVVPSVYHIWGGSQARMNKCFDTLQAIFDAHIAENIEGLPYESIEDKTGAREKFKHFLKALTTKQELELRIWWRT